MLFASKGFHATGVRDIAREADLTVAALYYYVESKDKLLTRIMESTMAQLDRAARKVTAPQQGGAEQIGVLVYLHISYHALNPLTTAVVDNELRSVPSDDIARVIAQRDEYDSLWDQAIADGISRGVFHAHPPSLYRAALLHMCTMAGRHYSSDGDLSLSDYCAVHAQMGMQLLGAVTSEKLLAALDLQLPGLELPAAELTCPWEPTDLRDPPPT